MNLRLDQERKQVIQEMSVEREHHQRLVKEHGRLQQRMENLLEERNAKSMPVFSLYNDCRKNNAVPMYGSHLVEDGHSPQALVKHDNSVECYDRCQQVSAARYAGGMGLLASALNVVAGNRLTDWIFFLLNPSNSSLPLKMKFDIGLRFRFASS